MSFPHAREGNERAATGATGIFSLPLACLSLSLQRFKRRAVIYYYFYTELLANLLSQLTRSFLGAKQRETAACSALKCSYHTVTGSHWSTICFHTLIKSSVFTGSCSEMHDSFIHIYIYVFSFFACDPQCETY